MPLKGQVVPAQLVATVELLLLQIWRQVMNEKRMAFQLQQMEHIRGHL